MSSWFFQILLRTQSPHVAVRRVVCPDCGVACAMKAHAFQRSWRHRDDAATSDDADHPNVRCSCDRCGVKTVSFPRAQKYSHFLFLREVFAMIDEKNCGAGQDFVIVMTDIDHSRVPEETPDGSTEAAHHLGKTLAEAQPSNVTVVSMDLWQAFEKSTRRKVPNAQIVDYRFHMGKYLHEAVDESSLT